VLVLEAGSAGGQAGTSSRIENYLGFPSGVSGQELAARAQLQAQKFGASVLVAKSAAALTADGTTYGVTLDDGVTVQARTVLIATGARYRRPALELAAGVSPGDSGAPVVAPDGHVVGIVFARGLRPRPAIAYAVDGAVARALLAAQRHG